MGTVGAGACETLYAEEIKTPVDGKTLNLSESQVSALTGRQMFVQNLEAQEGDTGEKMDFLEELRAMEKANVYYHVEGTITTTITNAGNRSSFLPRGGGLHPFKKLRAEKVFPLGGRTTIIPVHSTRGNPPVEPGFLGLGLRSKNVAVTNTQRVMLTPEFVAARAQRLRTLDANPPEIPNAALGLLVDMNTQIQLRVTVDVDAYVAAFSLKAASRVKLQ